MIRFYIFLFIITVLWIPSLIAQQTPYSGTPRSIPGIIKAEEYDLGGEGIAYHDLDAANQGGAFRLSEGVDIETCSEGGYNVGWMSTGEWIEYTVSVITTAKYTIRMRVASDLIGGTVHIAFNDHDVTGIQTVPNTGGWQQWVSLDIPHIQLDSGVQVMRLSVDNAGYNVTYVQFIKEIDIGKLPEMPNFSVQHGFYQTAFNVIVSSSIPNAKIKYTFDGSEPQTSSSALWQTSPAAILVDPESTSGQKLKVPGVILRACTLAPDSSMSLTNTRTYLFVDKVKSLSPSGVLPGPGWLASSSSQMMDYGVASDVVNSTQYKNLIDSALMAIPTISMVTELKNLFDTVSGIYNHALQDGDAWERPASIELLNPDGTDGFQINAGIRIRGGWSRHGDCPKHAFRLFFRSEYGQSKLKYPLFGTEGVKEFDKVDLRTGQNYSWSYPGHLGQYNTMISEVFSRDLQREMGHPYTRSRFYHLYIDGVYWGLFQTQERSEARYAASYFGGSLDDYDVIKIDDNYSIEATDGNTDAYREVWDYCVSGFQTNTNYFKLQGLNPDGTHNPSYKVLVDVDNLIDYMLVIFYAGNFDSPTSAFGSNQSPNNIYCIYNRNGTDGFKFFAHDAEHTLRTTAGEGPGIGLYENRVNISMNVSDFSKFHPQWLHYKLASNAEYRMRFADHVYKQFFNKGCLTPAQVKPLFLSRAKEIDMAIIGESARWGDTYAFPSRTKVDDWLPAINDIVNNYFPVRTNIVLNQLKDKAINLYPNIDPPIFQHNGTQIQDAQLRIGSGYKLKLLNPNNPKGVIYYTNDYQDPRSIGGAKASSAINGGNAVDLTIDESTVIMARVWNGDTCSALHEITFFVDPALNSVDTTSVERPVTFKLFQNYPNPFNPETKIRYTLKNTGKVRLSVLNILGQTIAILMNETQNSGMHEVLFSGEGLGSGVYFYKIETSEGTTTKKMVLIK
jgi:hypothetical protein